MTINDTKQKKGFTLIELLTAVAITVVIVGVLIGMTRVSLDSWQDSSNKAQASRLAKESLEVLARDFEGMVVRSGNNDQWLYAKIDDSLDDDKSAPTFALGGGVNEEAAIRNPIEIGFFTAATDRYDGQIGTNADEGGDVSTVFYRLVCKDLLNGDYPVYSLYRLRIDPVDAFNDHLGVDQIASQTDSNGVDYDVNTGLEETAPLVDDITEPDHFLAQNIYNLNLTFVFEYSDAGEIKTLRVPVMNSPSSGDSLPEKLSVQGDLILVDDGKKLTQEILDGTDYIAQGARLSSVELGMLVISDSGMNALRQRPFPTEEAFNGFLKKNSHYFTKSVVLPRP